MQVRACPTMVILWLACASPARSRDGRSRGDVPGGPDRMCILFRNHSGSRLVLARADPAGRELLRPDALPHQAPL
ncbi:hypothetical protein T492DRAFT_1045730 [Pavlovales sp. CCMP2436]|nr:hypothetical protein T492DRAFT_1045730 [Pavlovales sp. CCMP2436]